MSVASYQQPNDYNLVKDIRPFEMPYQSYMQEISTKQQYFKIAADRIKSIYDQAADLDPQYTQGKEYLSNFMKDASKNLEKLNKADLSVLDNSQVAVNIFKPLYDTKNEFNYSLLQDSQLNKFYQKQQQISDSYRTKNNGKEWNINNEIYFRDGQLKYMEDAKSSNDYSTVEKHFQNRKSFIPYYDYRDEIKQIQEMCKGYSQETQDVNSKNNAYFDYNSHSGCDPIQLSLAFQTGLSDRAKQQAHIDGYVHFRGNEDTLLEKFKNISIDNTANKISTIKASIAGLKAGKVTDKEQIQINSLNNLLSYLEPKYEKDLQQYNDITKGNPAEYVKNNYDSLSGQIYFDELTNTLGEAFRTDENKHKLLPNAVEMQRIKINADLQSQIMQNVHENNLEFKKHQYRKDEQIAKALLDYNLEVAKGTIQQGVPTPVDANISENPDLQVTKSQYINNVLNPSEKKATDAYNELRKYIIDKYGEQDPTKTFTIAGLEEFVNNHNNKDDSNKDPDLKLLYDNFKKLNSTWKGNIDYVRGVEAAVREKNKKIAVDYNTLDNNKQEFIGILASNSVLTRPKQKFSLSERDMFDILNGKEVNGVTYRNLTKEEIAKISPTEPTAAFFINGKRLVDTEFNGLNKLYMLEQSVRDKNNKYLEKVNTDENAYFTKKYYDGLKLTTADNLKAEPTSNLNQSIKGYLNVIGDRNEKNGYKIVYRGQTGEDIYVQPLDEDGKPIVANKKNNEIEARLKKTFKDAGLVETPAGLAYKIPNLAPRYPGLPSNYELEEEDENINRILSLQTFLETDPRMSASSRVDSRTLSDGITGIFLPNGKMAYVSIIKGASTGITYSALVEGTNQTLTAPTVQGLVEKLNVLTHARN